MNAAMDRHQPSLCVLKLRYFGFPPRRGNNMPDQGNALGTGPKEIRMP